MRKIPTIFFRDESKNGHPVINKIKPECQWVIDGEGVATRKFDGMNVKIENGKFYKRQKPKEGEYSEASYIQVEPISTDNKWLMEAFENSDKSDGIYEAVGPKIQGNAENMSHHKLIKIVPMDKRFYLNNVPRIFDSIAFYFQRYNIEGIVFHHSDGRMAKIKCRDFGLKRKNAI